jgi:hypothetical protein
VLIGNGYDASDSDGIGHIQVYEWNQGAGTLDYVDYIVAPGGPVYELHYDSANDRVYYTASQGLSYTTIGYIDLAIDPYVVADSAAVNLTYGFSMRFSPIYKSLLAVSSFTYLAQLLDNTLVAGASLNGTTITVVPAQYRFTFDNYDRYIYHNGTSFYYIAGFSDPNTAPSSVTTATKLFDIQGATAVDYMFYHTASSKIYALVSIGGTWCIQSYEVTPAFTQSDIEASVQTFTPSTVSIIPSTTGGTFKYIEGLEYIVLCGTGYVTFFDITNDTFLENQISTTQYKIEPKTILGAEYDSTNDHFWAAASDVSATPGYIHTYSLTSNSTDITGNFTGTLDPITHDGDRNCLTNDQIQNMIEQAGRFCCLTCKSDADITRDI